MLQGIGSMNSSKMSQGVNFTSFANELEDELVSDTLNVILKYEGDVQKAQNELSKLLEKKTAEDAAGKPQAQPAPAAQKKGILH